MLGHWELGAETVGGLPSTGGTFLYGAELALVLSNSGALKLGVIPPSAIGISFAAPVLFKTGVVFDASLNVAVAHTHVVKNSVKVFTDLNVDLALSHSLKVLLKRTGLVNATVGLTSPVSFSKIISSTPLNAAFAIDSGIKSSVSFRSSGNISLNTLASTLFNGSVQGLISFNLALDSVSKFGVKHETDLGLSVGADVVYSLGLAYAYSESVVALELGIHGAPFADFWSKDIPLSQDWEEDLTSSNTWTTDESLTSSWVEEEPNA